MAIANLRVISYFHTLLVKIHVIFLTRRKETSKMHSLKNKVLQIEITSPDTLNALNLEVLSALELALGSFYLQNKQDIHLIWIKPISIKRKSKTIALSGGDLKELHRTKDDKKAFVRYFSRVQKLCRLLSNISVPTICSIDGYVAGGGIEFLTCADLRFATTTSAFDFKQLKNGIFTGFGGCLRLSQLVGLSAAQKWVLLSSTIEAQEAQQYGLIQETYQDSTTMNQAIQEIAETFSQYSKEQIETQKKMLLLVKKAHLNAGLEEQALTEKNIYDPKFIDFLGSFNE